MRNEQNAKHSFQWNSDSQCPILDRMPNTAVSRNESVISLPTVVAFLIDRDNIGVLCFFLIFRDYILFLINHNGLKTCCIIATDKNKTMNQHHHSIFLRNMTSRMLVYNNRSLHQEMQERLHTENKTLTLILFGTGPFGIAPNDVGYD